MPYQHNLGRVRGTAGGTRDFKAPGLAIRYTFGGQFLTHAQQPLDQAHDNVCIVIDKFDILAEPTEPRQAAGYGCFIKRYIDYRISGYSVSPKAKLHPQRNAHPYLAWRILASPSDSRIRLSSCLGVALMVLVPLPTMLRMSR